MAGRIDFVPPDGGKRGPRDGAAAWDAMLDFTRRAAKTVPTVMMTIVNKDKTPDEIDACRTLAERLGARLRVREYIPD